MKSLIIILLSLSTTFVYAQNVLTWQGGTPGKESVWAEPKNWTGHQVPDEFSYVIIRQLNSGHDAQPVIDGEAEVASVEIHPGASLTVTPNGKLIIDNTYTPKPALLLFGGTLINKGLIVPAIDDGIAAGDTEPIIPFVTQTDGH